MKSEHSVERKPRLKRERNNIPERRTLTRNETFVSRPAITAVSVSDVHIITGWVVEDLGEGRLVGQCAAGSDELVESQQPLIYVIKRNPSTISGDYDRARASFSEGQG